MGVLRFFHWLTKNFPEIYTTASKGHKQLGCDSLYIDANALFHPCFREVFFPERVLIQSTRSQKEKEEVALWLVCKRIDSLIELAGPRKLVYIAIDGVAGLAKQAQQRKRRYKSALEKKDGDWDTANLTAGTDLMFRISDELYKYFSSRANGYKVVINDVRLEGEGEHKIIQHIRSSSARNRPTQGGSTQGSKFINFIYSPDADLIMLSLLIPQKGIHILRENIYKHISGDWFLVHCDAIKERVCAALEFRSMHVDFVPQRVVTDFVLFLFTIGNDFLPAIPAITIEYDGISSLFEVYCEVVSSHGYLFDGKLNWKSMRELFSTLAEYEPTLLLKKSLESKAKIPDSVLNKAVNRVEGSIKMDVYSSEYYKRNFPENSLVENICDEYVKGIVFVMQYYTKQIPSFSWYYPFHYAPLCKDLAAFFSTQPEKIYVFEKVKSLSLTQSLASVLHPKSFDLLPEEVRGIMKAQSVIDHDFSETCEFDYEGKIQDYEAICILPTVTHEKIKRIFSGCRLKEEDGVIKEIQSSNGSRFRPARSVLKNYRDVLPVPQHE